MLNMMNLFSKLIAIKFQLETKLDDDIEELRKWMEKTHK